jgi:hypothetical protein
LWHNYNPGVIDGGDTRWQGIDTNDKDYITIQNGTIQNINNANGRGIDAENTDELTVTGVTFDDIDGSGAALIYAKNCDDAVIQNNIASSNSESFYGFYYYGNTFVISGNSFTGGNYATAIHLAGNIEDMANGSVHSNTFTNVNATGTLRADGHVIGLAGGTLSSRTIDNVDVYNNTAIGCGEESRGALIAIYNSEGVDVYRNTLKNNFTTCIKVGTNSYDVDIYANLCYGAQLNADMIYRGGMIEIGQSTGGCGACNDLNTINIYNNTISNNDDSNSPAVPVGGIVFYCASAEGFTFRNINVKNNIINENMESAGANGWELYVTFGASCTASNIDLDYNDYYRDGNTNYFIYYDGNPYTYAQFDAYVSTESQDANSIDDDPLFKDAANDDYTIAENSPAYEQGVDVGLNFCETAPEIGYHEICSISGVSISMLVR